MEKPTKPKPAFRTRERLVWRADYWFDTSDISNVVIRDGLGRAIYENLHVSWAELQRALRDTAH